MDEVSCSTKPLRTLAFHVMDVERSFWGQQRIYSEINSTGGTTLIRRQTVAIQIYRLFWGRISVKIPSGLSGIYLLTSIAGSGIVTTLVGTSLKPSVGQYANGIHLADNRGALFIDNIPFALQFLF